MSLREVPDGWLAFPTCKFADLVNRLEEEDATTLFEWAQEGKSTTFIQKALKEYGCNISWMTLNRHLNGECCCGADEGWGLWGVRK